MSVPRNGRVEAPVAADPGGSNSSRLKAPTGPEPPKNTRVRVLAAPNVLNPKEFVRIEALPGCDQKEGKVLVRSKTVYKSSGHPREQVFWENYHRRLKQFDKGLFTPLGKPYLELGEIPYTDPKQLTLYALGQLREKSVEKDVQGKTPKEVAEVTTDKHSSKPESDAPEPVKRLSPLTETGKELRTLSESLASSRHHVNSVKGGGGYFRILQQESLERKNVLEASQQAQTLVWKTDFEPPMYSFDAESSRKERATSSQAESNHVGMSEKKKMTLQSFIPAQTNLLIPSSPEAKSEHLFRQLCVIHWLLEAMTLESNSSMLPILTCWNPKDCGGFKKTVKDEEELKLATIMWERFITKKKKYTWKTGYSLLSRTINKSVAPGISQFSSLSSPRAQTPQGSEASTVHCSEDNIKINDVSESAQAKERQLLFPLKEKGFGLPVAEKMSLSPYTPNLSDCAGVGPEKTNELVEGLEHKSDGKWLCEAANANGSAGNSQEMEDHEYYNEIPGKEPPTGGVLDMRMKVQMDHRANSLAQCKKQYCLTCSPTFINIYENCPEENKTVGNCVERSQKTKKEATLLKPAYKIDLFDDPCYINTQTLQSAVCTARGTATIQTHGSPLRQAKSPEAVQQSATSNTAGLCVLPQIKQQLKNEDCYHGKLNRKAAESLLVNDGDFLVRESTTSPGQYVLSGLQGGQAKHLLLVDPEGKVRTKDHIFDSVSHLIQYHMENNLPIISSGSEVSLKQPVRKDMQYHK